MLYKNGQDISGSNRKPFSELSPSNEAWGKNVSSGYGSQSVNKKSSWEPAYLQKVASSIGIIPQSWRKNKKISVEERMKRNKIRGSITKGFALLRKLQLSRENISARRRFLLWKYNTGEGHIPKQRSTLSLFLFGGGSSNEKYSNFLLSKKETTKKRKPLQKSNEKSSIFLLSRKETTKKRKPLKKVLFSPQKGTFPQTNTTADSQSKLNCPVEESSSQERHSLLSSSNRLYLTLLSLTSKGVTICALDKGKQAISLLTLLWRILRVQNELRKGRFGNSNKTSIRGVAQLVGLWVALAVAEKIGRSLPLGKLRNQWQKKAFLLISPAKRRISLSLQYVNRIVHTIQTPAKKIFQTPSRIFNSLWLTNTKNTTPNDHLTPIMNNSFNCIMTTKDDIAPVSSKTTGFDSSRNSRITPRIHFNDLISTPIQFRHFESPDVLGTKCGTNSFSNTTINKKIIMTPLVAKIQSLGCNIRKPLYEEASALCIQRSWKNYKKRKNSIVITDTNETYKSSKTPASKYPHTPRTVTTVGYYTPLKKQKYNSAVCSIISGCAYDSDEENADILGPILLKKREDVEKLENEWMNIWNETRKTHKIRETQKQHSMKQVKKIYIFSVSEFVLLLKKTRNFILLLCLSIVCFYIVIYTNCRSSFETVVNELDVLENKISKRSANENVKDISFLIAMKTIAVPMLSSCASTLGIFSYFDKFGSIVTSVLNNSSKLDENRNRNIEKVNGRFLLDKSVTDASSIAQKYIVHPFLFIVFHTLSITNVMIITTGTLAQNVSEYVHIVSYNLTKFMEKQILPFINSYNTRVLSTSVSIFVVSIFISLHIFQLRARFS